ncbi:hypothetical protein JCM11251_001320 [Rhodosporidiobolus azoricus]
MRLFFLCLFVSLALVVPRARATSGFYHYPCGTLEHGKLVPDDTKCHEGYIHSTGLVVPENLKCGFDDGDYWCGAVGAECPDGHCAHGLVCKEDPLSGTHKKTCQKPSPQPSHRAKRDTSAERRDMLCPGAQIACPLTGGHLGYECIDVQNNIEQCGGCAVQGGVDCSQLDGVDSVSCINGSCRVWGCGPGYSFHFRKRTCVPQILLALST